MPLQSMSRKVWTNPIHFIAFGFGVGLIRFMPGTFGTLVAIPFYILMQALPWQFYFAIVLIAFVVGIWICDTTEKAIGMPDYPGIVWDEIVGYWATMFLSPSGWKWILYGFVLFRFFDIVKPWPISWFNKNVHLGFGVMLDDLLAAVLAFAVLQATLWVLIMW